MRPQQPTRSTSSNTSSAARPQRPMVRPATASRPTLTVDEKKRLSTMLEGLIGTRGACVLDDKLNLLGKVPFTELNSTLKSLNAGVYAVVFDGVIDRDLVQVAEASKIQHIVAMDTKVKPTESRLNIVTAAQL